ncbi:hypothetical protein D9M68_494700 [compost metagenome]
MRVEVRIGGIQAVNEVRQLAAQTVMRNCSPQVFCQGVPPGTETGCRAIALLKNGFERTRWEMILCAIE